MFRAESPIFSTSCYANLISHKAKNTPQKNGKKVTNVNLFTTYLLTLTTWDYRNGHHTTEKCIENQKCRCITVRRRVREIDDEGLEKDLEAFNNFLVDSMLGTERQKVFIFVMKTRFQHTLIQKFATEFEKLKCAAQLIVTYGSMLAIYQLSIVCITMHTKATLCLSNQNLWQGPRSKSTSFWVTF